MSDPSWKQWERRVAEFLGGRRRGADYGDAAGGKNDVEHDHYSVECKLLSRPSWGDLVAACHQAERADPEKEPVAIVKKKGRGLQDEDALVVMRLGAFKKWRL